MTTTLSMQTKTTWNFFSMKAELNAWLGSQTAIKSALEADHWYSSTAEYPLAACLDCIVSDLYEGKTQGHNLDIVHEVYNSLEWELRETANKGQFGGATHEWVLISIPTQKMEHVVVMNEQHSLLPDQESLLPANYTLASVPATGWDLATIHEKSKKWEDKNVILVSPIPALMSIRAKDGLPFQVFHNDRREKKELPNGKIIFAVAKEGWELV